MVWVMIQKDFLWIHLDILHLNKATSKAPGTASPPLSQYIHSLVIQFCNAEEQKSLSDIPSVKKCTTRWSSLPMAPGFLCISYALFYMFYLSTILLEVMPQRLVKNTFLLGLMIDWDVCTSRSIPVPLNLHPEHWRNPRPASFRTGKHHHSFNSQIFKESLT